MVLPFVGYTLSLVGVTAAQGALARLSRRIRDSAAGDLIPYAILLLLLAVFGAEHTSAPLALAAASGILVVGAAVAQRLSLGRRGLFLAEIAAFLLLIRAGVLIDFIGLPSGGYLFLQEESGLLTLIWLVLVTNLLRVACVLPGLFEGVLALASFVLLASIYLRSSGMPGVLALAGVLSGSATALWLCSYPCRRPISGLGASLWAMAFGVLSVAGVAKRIALLSLVTPVLLVVLPILLFSYLIVTSYLAPNVSARKGPRWAIRWNLSTERTVDMAMLFCLLGNVLAMVAFFSGNGHWGGWLAAAGLVVYWRLLGRVLMEDRTSQKAHVPGGEISILGTSFPVLTRERVLTRLQSMIEGGGTHHLVTADSLCLLRAAQDEEYGQIIRSADLCVPDGAGVVWAADMLYESPLLERIPGVELVDSLAELAEHRRWRCFMLGGRPKVLSRARRTLQTRHPGLQIVGARHGYHTREEQQEILDEIRVVRPHILLVAMGVPLQDQWIARHRDGLGCPLLVGVGGTFDVLAGQARRAPLWLQRCGLEWLWRVAAEPQRLQRVRWLPLFVLEVLRAKLQPTSEELAEASLREAAAGAP